MKYIVKDCPAYDPFLLECRCETTPSILCWQNKAKDCPIRNLIELYDFNEKVREVFNIVEMEE